MITSAKVRAARRRLGESQSEFAERFGINQSTIHRWETEGVPTGGAARIALEHVLAEIEKSAEAAE